MSNDAPTSWQNLTDGLFTTSAYRAVGAWIGVKFHGMGRYCIEKISGIRAGDTIQNYPHSHGEMVTQSSLGVAYRDGVVVRRSLVTQNYTTNLPTGMTEYLYRNLDDAWTLVDKWRVWVGPVQCVWCEIEFTNNQAPTYGVYLRFANWEPDDTTEDHAIEEVSTTAHSSRTWHTVYGSLDGSLGNFKRLTIDGPTSVTDYGDLLTEREFRLYARKDSSAASDYLHVYNVHIFEQLTLET